MGRSLFQCTKRKRNIPNAALADGSRYFEATELLHITPPGSGATSVLGEPHH